MAEVQLNDALDSAHQQPEENSRHGRLAFTLRPPLDPATRTGLLNLADDDGGELAMAYVPTATPDGSARLVLCLHGANGSVRDAVDLMLPIAEKMGLYLLAPKADQSTWDLITLGFGTDVRRIDRLLADFTGRYPVAAVTVAGFSDGASYALSLGIGNGDIIDSVIAFSPGFAASLVQHGRPRIFVSHGTADTVLPIDRASRHLVPRLEADGYPVTYHEFDGPHAVPADIVAKAGDWLEGLQW